MGSDLCPVGEATLVLHGCVVGPWRGGTDRAMLPLFRPWAGDHVKEGWLGLTSMPLGREPYLCATNKGRDLHTA